MHSSNDTYINPINPTYGELFEQELNGYILAVPPYQRPYVWTKKKVETLMNDWLEYLQSRQFINGIDYYMGTIIIHKDNDNKKWNIVDGQQRLTTLLILDYVLNGESSVMIKYQKNIDINVNSNKSKETIGTITSLAKKKCKDGGRYALLKQNDIFNHLRFTVILTDNEDDAFTFFDSQNNRGVQPSAVDVLKAVHLRAIHADEELQNASASLWENTQNTGNNIFRNSAEQYLNDLIVIALWRLRTWKGSSFDYSASYESVMHEFSEKLSYSEKNNIKVYSIPTTYELIINSRMEANEENQIVGNSAKSYPFTVRQPLIKGICFFTFIKTYHQIALKLFVEKSEDFEIEKMRKLFNELYLNTNSTNYMSDYFIMLMIFYYDKFGSKDLYHFALCIDNIIGQWRINNYFFRKEAMMNITKHNNIIDKIQISYEPEDVIQDLLKTKIERRHEENPENSPIRKYKDANFKYFDQAKSDETNFVNNKIEWIKEIIENGK